MNNATLILKNSPSPEDLGSFVLAHFEGTWWGDGGSPSGTVQADHRHVQVRYDRGFGAYFRHYAEGDLTARITDCMGNVPEVAVSLGWILSSSESATLAEEIAVVLAKHFGGGCLVDEDGIVTPLAK
jgi:hypothetical protein